MRIANIDLDAEVLVVAEVGNNHEGSYALAEELVGLAAEAGAHAVKFQTYVTEDFISPLNSDRFARLKKFQLAFSDFEKLANHAKAAGICFLSTPFDFASADFLNSIVPAFKVASGDNDFYPLLDKICSFKKPMILSTGMADTSLIAKAKGFVDLAWRKYGFDPQLVLLHCVSSYPTAPAEANLASVATLKKHFQCVVGYSDHTVGIDAAVLSVSAGARLIEKHFTKSKTYSDFRDHQLSADPGDLRELVDRVRSANQMYGREGKQVMPCERATLDAARRSIVASRDLPKGHIITEGDILWMRAVSRGLAPGEETRVLGRMLGVSVQRGQTLTLESLSENR